MKIIETKGRIAEDGIITLPPGVLETMCVTAGDTVHLAYLSHHPVKQISSYGEFFLTKDGIDHVNEPVEAPESAEPCVPHALLDAAGIPLDDDLDTRCEGGAIIIGSADLVRQLPPQLMEPFDSLGVSHATTRCVLEGGAEDGLFTDAGVPVVLAQVQKDVCNHKGAVWTHVISLRREDAARLGYDSGKQWQDLLRSKKAMLCKHMKIDSENLRWYAAFHDESHHPHMHLMVYSAKDNNGFLTEPAIEAIY